MEYREVELLSLFNGVEFGIDVDNSGEYETPLYDKFTEAYRVDDYEVLSHNGWIDIEGVGKTIPFDVWHLETSDGNILKCADKHIVLRLIDITDKVNVEQVYVADLNQGDLLKSKDGYEMVMDVYKTDSKSEMYDLQVQRGTDNLYYTDNLLSHNSLWMQNIAANTANMGYNVVYFTLEMSEAKVMKRLGSMRLNIPINEYDEKSKDLEYIKKKLEALNSNHNSNDPGNLFQNKLGQINVKFFAAGTATIESFDNHLKNLEQKRGFKPDIIIVDYITLMAPMKGLGIESNLYLKGKHLAEALRAMAAARDCALVTAMQISKDAWNANDITLDKIPESKAIAETADTFFAIIRNEEMKRDNKYVLKMLKQRDGDFSRSRITFDLNPRYLTIVNDSFVNE